MFGEGGMVTGVLNKDVEENTGGFERASAPLIAKAAAAGSTTLTTIGDVLAAEVGEIGVDGARKAKKKSAVVCALWVSRALLFVGRFGARLITTPNSKPADVARSVYDEVLRPYHGFLVSNVVNLAFSFAPCVLPRMPTFAAPRVDAHISHTPLPNSLLFPALVRIFLSG